MKHLFFQNKKDNQLSAEAADWFLKSKSGPMTPEEEVEFYAWLVENPKHKQKFDIANALWHVSENLADDLREIAEMDDIQHETRTSPLKRWIGRLHLRTPALQFSAVLAILIVIVLGLWLKQPAMPQKETYRTETGEQKKVYFSDGSLVILDTESILSRHYTETSRDIELIKGRAFFSVVSDPDRPFVVATGKVQARAVGTDFNVYRDDKDRISVTVTEGLVQVSQKTSQLPADGKKHTAGEEVSMPPDVIGAGEEIVIDDRQQKKEVKTVDVQRANTWQEGRLYFQNAQLETVIDEINRYLVNKIIIRDYTTGNLTVSLNYDIRRHDKFLATLEKVLPVAYEKGPNGKIYLYQIR